MPKTVLDLERYVPHLLVSITNKLSAGGAHLYRKLYGVGVTEWRILAMLAIEPSIPASRVCQVIGLDKALVSRVTQTLAQRGLVSVKKDQSDTRRQLIMLTAKGNRLHDDIINFALRREQLLVGDLSREELKVLTNLLSRLHARVDAVNAYKPMPKDTSSRKQKGREPMPTSVRPNAEG